MGRLPAVVLVEVEKWLSVRREGPLVKRLFEVAEDAGVRVLEVGGIQEFASCRARRKTHYPQGN